jgi:ribonuclease R
LHAETIEKEAAHRSDFRGTATFTIDPPDAKDFDDALSIRKLPDGTMEIGIHIADVSYFVREGTKLDDEAQKRGTSVYLVDATIPMLPHELSGNVCSLRPDEDRLAFSTIVKITPRGEVLERRFERTIICSQKRFTYEEAQKVLDAQSGVFLEELNTLRSLARILRKQREEKGAIDFGDNEVRFTLDEQGTPLSVTRKERIETNLLVEEFMLLANREVAQFVSHKAAAVPERGLIFLYRIHDEPKQDRIEELSTFVRAIGYEFGRTSGDKHKKYSARDIAGLLEQIKGKPEEHLIRTATLRSMAKAIYSTKNIGHFGLAFEYYTHFTSPIRRYPDVLAHRILASHLGGKPITRSEFIHLEKLCLSASEQEAKAVDAERDSIRYKQVEYMSSKVGQTFEGVISGVTDWGIYVEEKESASEGLVRVRTIGDDFYNYSQKEYALIGQRSKKKYALGDRVRVRLVAADLIARQLDFELV